MTEPREPEELATSVRLPEPEPEPIYDTGSDGWWRAQARAQRAAAEDEQPPAWSTEPPAWSTEPPAWSTEPLHEPAWSTEPLYEPAYDTAPELVEPQVLLPETPPPAAPAPAPAPPPAPVPVQDRGEEVPVHPAPAVPRATHVPQPEPDTWYDENPGVRQPFEQDPPRGARHRVLGALLAVAGVSLAILALLWVRSGPQGSPTVAQPPLTAVPTGPVTTAAPTAAPTAVPTAAPSPAAPSASPAAAAAPFVPLTVLNNSRVNKLAERSAARFRAAGWPIRETGNFTGRVETSTVYYPPGQRASAERFARQFGVRVLPRFDALPGTGMTVVLTRDFA